MRVKICGLTHYVDAINAATLGADMLGFIVQPGLLRYVKPEFLDVVRKAVNRPLVAVKLDLNFDGLMERADYVQVHRVLSREELDALTTYSKKFILYVPGSEEGLRYVKEVNRVSNALVLVDSARKGEKLNLEIARKILDERPDSGVAGGITPENVLAYLDLNPGWIDVSSGVESEPAKKDVLKMKKLMEVVKGRRP